jgi:hypothetical protein
MIRLLLCILLLATAAGATEPVTVITGQTTLSVIVPTDETVTRIAPVTDPDVDTDIRWLQIERAATSFNNELAELRSLSMYAGSQFTFSMQMRLGTVPQPFDPGYWPSATLRTARSPGGVLVHTFTTDIDDEAQAIWSFRLTPSQTNAIAARKLIMEISFPNLQGGNYIYEVWYHIPVTVFQHITE